MSQPATTVENLTVTTDRATLAHALASVAPVINRSPSRPIMEGVLLTNNAGDLLLTGYDHRTAITVRLPGAAHGTARVVVHHGETTKLLSALTGCTRRRGTDHTPVAITTSTDGTKLDVAGYAVPVTAWPTGDYPVPSAAVATVAHVDRDTFTTEIQRVLTTASTDETLPQICGVQLTMCDGTVRLAATDRYRMATVDVPALSTVGDAHTERPQVIIHTHLLRKLVRLIAKLSDVSRIRIGTGRDERGWPVATLICGPVTITTQTTSQSYLDHHEFVGNLVNPIGTVTAERAALLAHTERAYAVQAAKGTGLPVLLTIGTDTVSIAPELPDGGSVTAPDLPAEVDGVPDHTVFRFNAGYLTDALGCFAGETVTIHLPEDVTRAVLLTDSRDGRGIATACRHVLLPVRVSDHRK